MNKAAASRYFCCFMLPLDETIAWFKDWFKLKIKIHLSERILYFREKEIWWASLGANVGFEQNGKNENYERPILVVRKFNKDMLWAVPLTSKPRTGIFYYNLNVSGTRSTAILSQLRLISSKRLIRKINIVSTEDLIRIKEKIKQLV